MIKRLPKRKRNSHKGDYGHVFVIAGSSGLTGAAYLTSQAALLSGSGLVTLGLPKSLNTILARKLTEVMTKPLPETKKQTLAFSAYKEIEKFIEKRKIDALAIGPGLSQNTQTQRLIRRVISKANVPMVIDADGLNALVDHLKVLQAIKSEYVTTVITPHPGEMARLLGTTTAKIQRKRKELAKSFAKKYNATVVLKGHHTVVADPSGKTYINNSGNPGMASGGCGDVLTGMITSFMGQGLRLFDAARLGVYLHGLTGDLVARKKGEVGLVASDLLNVIPRVLKKY